MKREKRTLSNNSKLADEIEFEQYKVQKKIYEKKKARIEKKKRIIEKEIKSIVIPKSVMKIIEHWNSCPLRKLKMRNSKLFLKTVIRLKQVRMGKFFKPNMITDPELAKKYIGKKILPDEFIRAINNFVLVTDNPLYIQNEIAMKCNKKKSLCTFIYEEMFFNKDGKMREEPIKESLLLRWLENNPKPNGIPTLKMPDRYPQLTLRLKNLYVKNVLGGVETIFRERDLNCFRMGADKLHKFYMANIAKMQYLMGGETEMADLLYKALEKKNGQEIYPGMFCSYNTFVRVLPRYLNNENIIKNEKMIIPPDQ